MKYALINCVIYTKYEILRDYAVVINGETIEAVTPQSELESGIKTLDLQGFLLCLPQIFQRYFLCTCINEAKSFGY